MFPEDSRPLNRTSLTSVRRPSAARRQPRDFVLLRLALLTVLAIGLAVVYLAFVGRESAPIAYPLAAILAASALFYSILWMREGVAPFFTIGAIAGAMPVLYCVYPLTVFWLRGLRFGLPNDNRLYAAQPTPAQMGAIAWWYVAYFVTFAASYLLVTMGRGRRIRLSGTPTPPCIVILII